MKTKPSADKIKDLLVKGYSASKIAKTLHIRKQKALEEVRKVTGIKKQNAKVTNKYGQKGKPLTPQQSKLITDMYRQGYSKDYISKYAKISIQRINRADLKKDIEEHKRNNRRMRALFGKGYKIHLDGKFYRHQKEHYYKLRQAQFEEGTPRLSEEDYGEEEGMAYDAFTE